MEEKIRKYAKFLIEGCLRLKKGDKLFIIGYRIIEDFVNILIEEAKKLGINDIETLVIDEQKQIELLKKSSFEELKRSPYFDKTKYNVMAEKGYAFLNLSTTLPGHFDDIDEELLNNIETYQLKSIVKYREYQSKGLIKWNIACVPNARWSKNLFGDEDVTKLWEYILDICLINTDDPIEEWNKKLAKLKKRADYLNSLEIDSLIYKNSLGTNLEIGLPKNYLFASAEGINIVNMPTEEVFTSPDRLRVNGIVYSSKILLFGSRVIDKFWLKFKDGKIIDYDAEKGKEILDAIINTDEGARFLGEVALVDYDSKISKTDVIFKNTLYDENASCHLAIGASFPECIKGGLDKTAEELLKEGLNYSHEHVDFFIGTRDLEVNAILKNGEIVKIMEQGNLVIDN